MGHHEFAINLTASAFAVGTAALLISAPIASADDPPSCAPDDQQCQEQQKQQQGQDIAGQVIDNVEQGIDQVKDANQGNKPPNRDGPYTGLYVLLNGVPTCIPFGVATSALDRVEVVPGYPNHGRC